MKFNDFKQKIKSFPVFSSSLFSTITKEKNTLKVQITKWKKQELITQVKRGLYTLGEKERIVEPSSFYLANQIIIPSYISLESALSYYELIPEFVATITSITTRKTSNFKNKYGTFLYQHIKTEGYTGFRQIKDVNNLNILIASPEKAVVDFIYLNLDKFNSNDIDCFTESYRFQNMKELSRKKIKLYAKLFNSKKLNTVIDNFILGIKK